MVLEVDWAQIGGAHLGPLVCHTVPSAGVTLKDSSLIYLVPELRLIQMRPD